MRLLYTGETQHLEKGFEGSSTDFSTIALSFYGVLFTYDGWYILIKMYYYFRSYRFLL